MMSEVIHELAVELADVRPLAERAVRSFQNSGK